ncbi:MAG TPA: class I SAM-dependent methyltransferase [Clostridiaceae bacterium]|nr:class I SAM-dependent methyltransferase [Clostridiaceae bacterium]
MVCFIQGGTIIYTSLAYVYDKLMSDVDYTKWADYIEKIFEKNDYKPSLIADLGCGTGSFCIEMAERNYEMIGIDISYDMLSCAKNKSLEKNLDILFINQDISNFELHGTVDAFTCLLDSLNYITRKNDVRRLFRLVYNYLNPGGLFIFDINTRYKFEKILGNNVFYSVDNEVTYIWENKYNKKKQICQFDITLFIKEDDKYRRYDEIHYERAYSEDELRKLAEQSGLKVLNIYDAMKFTHPDNKSERIFFVCKKLV